MSVMRQMTAIIEREGDGYVSLCPELDIASQGATIEEARANLTEALELFFDEILVQQPLVKRPDRSLQNVRRAVFLCGNELARSPELDLEDPSSDVDLKQVGAGILKVVRSKISRIERHRCL